MWYTLVISFRNSSYFHLTFHILSTGEAYAESVPEDEESWEAGEEAPALGQGEGRERGGEQECDGHGQEV